MSNVAPTNLNTAFNNATSNNNNKTPRSPLSGNPLTTDSELTALMDKLDSINSFRAFRKWKTSFLRRFETFLSQSGIQPAEDSYESYSSNMALFEKKVNQAKVFLDKGDLSPERTTVKGRMALNNMCNTTKDIIDVTESLIPATNMDEKRRKYNKYHLGCVLVREGFQEYERMIRCNDKIMEMRDNGLAEVADRQQLETIKMYDRQIVRFRSVMEDLGLYGVMMKCRQFAGGEVDEIILLDPKTGAVMEIPREACFSTGVLNLFQDEDGNDKIREEETSRLEKEELIATLQLKFGL